MKKLFLLLPTLLLNYALMAENVSNVRAMQQDEKVVVVYDLLQNATTSLYVSFDGGKSFQTANSVSGEVGQSQMAGSNKVIYWNAVQDAGYFDCPNIVFKVVAVEDGTSLPSASSLTQSPSDGTLPADRLHIGKDSPNHYTYNGLPISHEKAANMAIADMRNQTPTATYRDYLYARKLIVSGWSLFGGGIILSVGMGAPLWDCSFDPVGEDYWGRDYSMWAAGISLVVIGFASIIASVPTLSVGYARKYKAVDQYLFGKQVYNYTHNMPNSPSQPDIELRPSYNGLGLAITF